MRGGDVLTMALGDMARWPGEACHGAPGFLGAQARRSLCQLWSGGHWDGHHLPVAGVVFGCNEKQQPLDSRAKNRVPSRKLPKPTKGGGPQTKLLLLLCHENHLKTGLSNAPQKKHLLSLSRSTTNGEASPNMELHPRQVARIPVLCQQYVVTRSESQFLVDMGAIMDQSRHRIPRPKAPCLCSQEATIVLCAAQEPQGQGQPEHMPEELSSLGCRGR